MSRRTVVALAAGVAVLMIGILIGQLLPRPADPTTPQAAAPPAASTVLSTPATTSTPTPVPTDPTVEGDPAASASSSAGGPTASAGSTPYSQTSEARRQWGPVIQTFGANFTRTAGKSAAAWRAKLNPLVTVPVRKQLSTVDPRNVPSGRYARYEPVQYDEEEMAAKVTYREGWALVVYVTHDNGQWRIYRYDRWEE